MSPPTDLPVKDDQNATTSHAAEPSRAGVALVVALVASAAFAVGWPSRNGDFLRGDDHTFILNHVYINHPSLKHAGKLLTMVHGDLYQPLPMLTFQADYALAGPDPSGRFPISPFVFHLTNILLHTLNAALVCLIAWRLSRRRSVALITGVAFACHPFAVEPVAWITGRMILMATTFSLIVILACLYRRPDGRGAWRWIAGICWPLALLSKVLPSVPLAAAWCDHARHGRLNRRCWITYAILLGMSAIGSGAALSATQQAGFIEKTAAESTTAAPVRMLLASRYYFENFVRPTRLSAWSPPPEYVRFLSWDVAIAVAEWAVLLGLVAITRRRERVVYVGLVLFLILIGPFLAATAARRFLTADRYMYLPMMGLHLALAGGAVRLWDVVNRRLSISMATAAIAIPCVLILCIWGWIDRKQTAVWSSIIAQGKRTMQVYPNDPDVHIELAHAYLFEKMPDKALKVLNQVRRRWPDNLRTATLTGEALRLKEDWPAAEAVLRRAVRQRPQHSRTRYHYGLTLEDIGRKEEARSQYLKVLEYDDGYLPAVTALARSYLEAGEIDRAIEYYERAIKLNAHHRNSLLSLAKLMFQRGKLDRARELVDRVLDFDPHDGPAALYLGLILTNQGRTDEALKVYDRLLAVEPNASAARLNRAELLANTGRATDAERDYQAVLETQPDNLHAAIGIHEILQAARRFEELPGLWERVRAARTTDNDAGGWLVWAYVLAGRMESARAVAEELNHQSTNGLFADWAFVYDAMRKGDFREAARRLESMPGAASTVQMQGEQIRLIGTSLSDLPRETRDTAAGRYLLARLLALEGNRTAALTAAQSVDEAPDAESWRGLAGILVKELQRANGATTKRAINDETGPH